MYPGKRKPCGAAVILAALLMANAAEAEIQRFQFQTGDDYLRIELLDDDLVHVEYGHGNGPGSNRPIPMSELVCQPGDGVPATVCNTDFTGPAQFSQPDANTLETADLRLRIDASRLAVSVFDKAANATLLTTFEPLNLHQDFKGLAFTRGPELDVYGLGQQFVEPGNADIDWDGRVREGGPFGNVMSGFNGGANGNTQIPVLYAVNGATQENYALFLDNARKQRWDFQGQSQWKVEMAGDRIRFFLMSGPDLLDLRRDYMDLVGHPLVPPKRMFGLWISEYGYDQWNELEDKLATLRANRFPIDGFVLDLQWFGGIPSVTGKCRMGALDFDPSSFPDPTATIASLRDDHQVGVMLIEEAYVCDQLPEHARLDSQGCLVDDRPGSSDPAFMCGFWGCGGMIDYTDDNCSRHWHQDERKKLVDAGVIGHWTDLGEPEMFSEAAGYAAGTHAQAHNIFNFRWLKGIYQGYREQGTAQRPFMMSRSGNAGIQRYGTAMWSGDIASRLSSLAAHAANQMHMSFSGIDYYGADIGGFHRNLEGDLDEMYTQWFAYGMMFDIPGRPHVENLCNCKETAPDRIGNKASNLANARLRYSLIPYLYSLAHRAYRFGEPVMPPLVMYYQSDDNVRSMGNEKLLGRDLLAAVVAKHGETERDVYLPAGVWYDWHSGRRIASQGFWLPNVRVADQGAIQLPLYARAGAIVPMMPVDAKTLDAHGDRSDGTRTQDLAIRVFPPAAGSSEFTLYEDDGKTIAYQQGAVRTTRVTQNQADANKVAVTVEAAVGSYTGAPSTRNVTVDLVTAAIPQAVNLNGTALPQRASPAEFEANDSGWLKAGAHSVLAKSGPMAVTDSRNFEFALAPIPGCTSDHRSVSVPGAGNGWDPADPVRQLTDCTGKSWSGRLTLLGEEYKFAADGAWSVNWGSDGQQGGPNFSPLAAGVYDVTFNEDDAAHPLFNPVGPAPEKPLGFRCENGHTVPGISVYVVGNVPEIGAWDAKQAVKLEPDGPYPTWTGRIPGLPTDTAIEWKCIKRNEGNDMRVIQWEPGANNVVDRGQDTQLGQF